MHTHTRTWNSSQPHKMDHTQPTMKQAVRSCRTPTIRVSQLQESAATRMVPTPAMSEKNEESSGGVQDGVSSTAIYTSLLLRMTRLDLVVWLRRRRFLAYSTTSMKGQ